MNKKIIVTEEKFKTEKYGKESGRQQIDPALFFCISFFVIVLKDNKNIVKKLSSILIDNYLTIEYNTNRMIVK